MYLHDGVQPGGTASADLGTAWMVYAAPQKVMWVKQADLQLSMYLTSTAAQSGRPQMLPAHHHHSLALLQHLPGSVAAAKRRWWETGAQQPFQG